MDGRAAANPADPNRPGLSSSQGYTLCGINTIANKEGNAIEKENNRTNLISRLPSSSDT